MLLMRTDPKNMRILHSEGDVLEVGYIAMTMVLMGRDDVAVSSPILFLPFLLRLSQAISFFHCYPTSLVYLSLPSSLLSLNSHSILHAGPIILARFDKYETPTNSVCLLLLLFCCWAVQYQCIHSRTDCPLLPSCTAVSPSWVDRRTIHKQTCQRNPALLMGLLSTISHKIWRSVNKVYPEEMAGGQRPLAST